MTVDQTESAPTTETGGDAEARRKKAQETLAKRKATIAAKAAGAVPAAPPSPVVEPEVEAAAVEEALDGAPGTDANPEPEVMLAEGTPEFDAVAIAAHEDARRLALQDEADEAAAKARQEALDAGVPLETLQAIEDGIDDAVARFDPEGESPALTAVGEAMKDALIEEVLDPSPEGVATRLGIDVPPGYRPVHDGQGGLRFEARDPRYALHADDAAEPGAEAAAILAAARQPAEAPQAARQADGRGWMPEGQELHPGNVEPEAIVSTPAPVHTTISEVTRLEGFLRANYPQEFSNDHNYVHGQTPVDVAIRLMTRLSAVARPEAVQRCTEQFCNKPAGHFPASVHGWVEAAGR